MKNFFCLTLACLILSFAAFGVSEAKTFPNEEAKVQITIFDNWKVELKNNVLVVESPEEGINLMLETLKDDNVSAALEKAENVITKELGGLITEKTGEIILNGMPTMLEDYKTKDGLIKVSVMLILTPAKKYMLCYYLGSEDADRKYAKELTEIIGSIKAIEK